MGLVGENETCIDLLSLKEINTTGEYLSGSL